jgi:hypothetical protein
MLRLANSKFTTGNTASIARSRFTTSASLNIFEVQMKRGAAVTRPLLQHKKYRRSKIFLGTTPGRSAGRDLVVHLISWMTRSSRVASRATSTITINRKCLFLLLYGAGHAHCAQISATPMLARLPAH